MQAAAVLRLSDDPDYGMTAAEHLEEVLRLTGLDHGGWQLQIRARDGHIERLVADPVAKVALGRDELHARRRELSSEEPR